MGKSLADLTAEIRENNISHGWRPAEGGPGDRTFGDFIALLHSEVSEALEAYRDHRLADATDTPHDWRSDGSGFCRDCHCTKNRCKGQNPKPEGVGSELADVLIRLLDMCDVFGIKPFDMDCELADVAIERAPGNAGSFGDYLTWLHGAITDMGRLTGHVDPPAYVLRALVSVAERHGIDLTAEVERKIAYNRTRPFRHGGRHL